jgi:hypothetical protein
MNWSQVLAASGLMALVLAPIMVLATRTLVVASVERAVEREFRQWEVRFTKLHERRVEAMEGIMDRLIELKRTLDAATGIQSLDDPHGLKHLQDATEAGREAQRYLAARRFYLPKESAEKVEALLKETKEAWASLTTGAEGRARGEIGAAHTDLLRAGYKTVRESLPGLIAEVEGSFRKVVES